MILSRRKRAAQIDQYSNVFDRGEIDFRAGVPQVVTDELVVSAEKSA